MGSRGKEKIEDNEENYQNYLFNRIEKILSIWYLDFKYRTFFCTLKSNVGKDIFPGGTDHAA